MVRTKEPACQSWLGKILKQRTRKRWLKTMLHATS